MPAHSGEQTVIDQQLSCPPGDLSISAGMTRLARFVLARIEQERTLQADQPSTHEPATHRGKRQDLDSRLWKRLLCHHGVGHGWAK